MAYRISSRAQSLLNKTNIEPNLVLCIDGYPQCFGAEITRVFVRIGMMGLYVDGSWLIGGTISDENILDYISLDGTTTSITQQLDLDKNNATSTQTVKVRLVDFQGQITRLIAPGFDLNDVLYRNARLYLGFQEGSFPEDYVDLFIGKVQSVESGAGFVEVTIAHPDELKRSEVFPRIETSLVSNADYYTKTIQDLVYYQAGNFPGIVQVQYIDSPFIGDVANISVSGNLIQVTMDAGSTKAKTIKEAITDNPIASQMVAVKISGTGSNPQTAQPITSLEVDDTIQVDSVDGFLLPYGDIFKTYLRIGDEIIEYTGINTLTNTFTGCVRRSLNSIGQFHEANAQVQSFYKLGDGTEESNAIDLTLKLMLSDGVGNNYVDSIADLEFYNFGTPENYPNGFLIRGVDAVRLHNIQVGDFCTVTGSGIPGNNFIDGVIEDIEQIDLGTVIYVTGQSFAVESPNIATCSFRSQYNVLPDGCGFIPAQVDIERFKLIQSRFPSQIANYEIYLKDTVKPKDFINSDLFLPSALYSIPRQGKASIGINAPPLYEGGTKTLNIETLKNPSKLKTSRSISKYFYNAIVFKYNEDSVEDRLLSGRIIYSADSQNRINAPNKPYTINARGLRPSALNTQLIERNSKRLLERYQFAAETIPVEPDYKTGYTIEVGDSVVFGDSELQVSDTINGSRDFQPRVFEVVNKEFNWKTGSIRLHIVDTNYSSKVRYGVWSPASILDSGSTVNAIKVTNSYGSDNEREKWQNYIGRTVRVRSEDYTTSYLTKLLSFDDANESIFYVTPLPAAPTSGFILDVPNYDDLNAGADSLFKALHPFWTPTLTVTGAYDEFEVFVGLGEGASLFAGCIVRVRSSDYTRDSGIDGVKVTAVAGDGFICEGIGFTPLPGDLVELIGFASDEGAPYVWL